LNWDICFSFLVASELSRDVEHLNVEVYNSSL
jgi:hypothetical protein